MSTDAVNSPAPVADDRGPRLRTALQAEFDLECQRRKVKTDGSASADQLERVWQALVSQLAMNIQLREKICKPQDSPPPFASATNASQDFPFVPFMRWIFRRSRAVTERTPEASQFFTLEHGGWINEWLDEQAQKIAKKFPRPTAATENAELHRLRRRLLDVRVGPSTFIKNARAFRIGHALTPAQRTSEEINLHQPQVQNVFLVPPPGYGGRPYALDDYCRAVADGTADDGVLVVTGVRGSGKSTLLNRVEMFCNNWQVAEHRPFYLRFDLGCHFGPRFLLNLLEALARSAYDHCRRPPFARAAEKAPGQKNWWAQLLAACPRSYVGIIGRSGRWCSGNLRWALLMLMVGWLAIAALLLAQRPEPAVIQGQALFRSLQELEKKFGGSLANQAGPLGELKEMFQILDSHEQKFRKNDWVVAGVPSSTNEPLFVERFQRSLNVLKTNLSQNGWQPVFSNGWNFFVFNPYSPVPVRWVGSFTNHTFLATLPTNGANSVLSNNFFNTRNPLSVELRRLITTLQPVMPSPDNGALPTLSSDDQGTFYVVAFALLAIVAVGSSHNFYRRAVGRESSSAVAKFLLKYRRPFLWLMAVVVLGVLSVSMFGWSVLLDGWSHTPVSFFVMAVLMLAGVMVAYVCSWNHQLAPRDEVRAETDWPWMRDGLMVVCLVWFFSALIITVYTWHFDPMRRTCGTLAIGGSIAVAALCIAQSWLPAWWDFKFRCYDLLTQLTQRTDKEPGDLPLVGQLAALAKMFLPVGVAGPDYQAMETPFLEQELKRLLHDCRVHFGRVIVLIDDIDVLPGEKHPELLRILRPVSKVRGATFLIAAPLHFFHLYRYASLNDVQSTVQNVIVMGDPELFTGADGKKAPFQLKMDSLLNSLQQLLAANMRVPCASHALPLFVQKIADCWVEAKNVQVVKDELDRCGSSKRELLRELDRMLSNPGRQPFEDRGSSVDQKKWVDEEKARFSGAEREANPDFRPEEKSVPPASPLDGWTFQLQVTPVKKNSERPALDC